ncbi:MAG: NAD(P)/FAD-dependent oxidoreductase [Pyrodictiaceae archaeon]
MSSKYDLIVIGSGIGGYPAAILLAKHGLRVAVVEKEPYVGGECTNYGCTPSKAMLFFTHVLSSAIRLGIATIHNPKDLLPKALELARNIVAEDREGLETIFERVGVEVINGKGLLKARHGEKRVIVEGRKRREITSDKVLLAPGSDPLWPSWVERCERVVDNRAFFARGLPEDSESIAIIGGGVIGVEFAQFLSDLGLKVTVYEAMDRLLPMIGDRDLSRIAQRLLASKNVEVLVSKPIGRVKCRDNKVEVCTTQDSCREYNAALIAVGRKPATSGIGLEESGIALDEKGYIKVGRSGETTIPGIYASGDAIGQPFLAHKAAMESLTVASTILGRRPPAPRVIPFVVYGEVELVHVRLEEPCEGCRKVTVKNYWGYNIIARVRGVKPQLVYSKITYDKETGRILEASVAGPNASELAAELTLAIQQGIRLDELRGTIHPHPSASEAILDNVLAALGEIYNRA